MNRDRKSGILHYAFSSPFFVNAFMLVSASLIMMVYDNHIRFINPDNFLASGLAYALKYIPIVLLTGLGGSVPGMISVLSFFMYKSVIFSSFSYLTFIYLVVACTVDVLARKGFFRNWARTVVVVLTLQIETGVFWTIILWLLSGKDVSTLSEINFLMYFLNELPGSLLGCSIIYLLFRFLPDRKKLILNNGKYYVDPSILSEDDRYLVEGRSKLGKVVMQVIVFEAIVLGISAEIASNTLVPTMKYVNISRTQGLTVEEDFSEIKNAERLEGRVSFRLQREYEQSIAAQEEYSVNLGLKDSQFSVKLAMLISIIVIPMAIFVNRYAQRRIAEPIRSLSKAVSDIYNSNDLEINEKVNEVHNLNINTKDEIEELYHAVDLTFYRLMEYIELVKSRQSIEDQLQVEKSANEAKSRFLSIFRTRSERL